MSYNGHNNTCGIPPEVLQDMAYRINVHTVLTRWLHQNHTRVFLREAAKGKNYVVALPPKPGSNKPDLSFYTHRAEVLAFCKQQTVSAYDYKESHKLLLMY